MKNVFIALIITFVLAVSSQAYRIPPYYLEPDVRQQYTTRMNELIGTIGFEGKYSLIPDDRIFITMNGDLPSSKVPDLKSYKICCDSLVSILKDWYKPIGKTLELEVSVYRDSVDGGKKITENGQTKYLPLISFIYSCKQTFNGNRIKILDNREAAESYYKNPEIIQLMYSKKYRNIAEQSASDSTSWYLSGTGLGNRTESINCYLEIKYYPDTKQYYIINNLFLQPVVLPKVEINKDKIIEQFGNNGQTMVHIRNIGYMAIPQNRLRTEFDYKYIYEVQTGKYGGYDYIVDGTSGEIISQNQWIE